VLRRRERVQRRPGAAWISTLTNVVGRRDVSNIT